MLATGFTTRRGRRGAYLHHDAVNGVLRARKGARLTAITSGGAIPDLADYQVVLQPASTVDRHGPRGLRRREPGRGRLPARQRLLADHQGRAGAGAGGGRQGAAAEHPLLAGRGAGAHRGAVGRRLAAARGGGPDECARDRGTRPPPGWRTSSALPGRRGADRRLPGRRRRGAGRHAHPGHAGRRALLRRGGGPAPGRSTRRSAAA